MKSVRRAFAVAVMAGGVTACLLGPQVEAADACQLLTQAEVAALLGVEAVDAGEHLLPSETRFCTWREHGKNQMQARNVKINYLTAEQYERGKTPIPNMIKAPETGIGDDAYFTKLKGMVFNLSVKKGGTYFRIAARSNPDALVKANDTNLDEKDKAIDRAIARAVLKKTLLP